MPKLRANRMSQSKSDQSTEPSTTTSFGAGVQHPAAKGEKARERTRAPKRKKAEEDIDEEARSPSKNDTKGVQQGEKVTKKRKTKAEKEAEAMPLAGRATGLRMYIGAHVSAAKGVQNSVTNSLYIGGNAFAMFLKSQRKWENPALQDEHRDTFISRCKEHAYSPDHILPHGS